MLSGVLKCCYHKLKQTKGNIMSMSGTPKEKTDQVLIDAFLNKGGKVTKGKTKPMKHELGLSNNVWNNPLTKDEKKSLKK
jgi:hypothetical protein